MAIVGAQGFHVVELNSVALAEEEEAVLGREVLCAPPYEDVDAIVGDLLREEVVAQTAVMVGRAVGWRGVRELAGDDDASAFSLLEACGLKERGERRVGLRGVDGHKVRRAVAIGVCGDEARDGGHPGEVAAGGGG